MARKTMMVEKGAKNGRKWHTCSSRHGWPVTKSKAKRAQRRTIRQKIKMGEEPIDGNAANAYCSY